MKFPYSRAPHSKSSLSTTSTLQGLNFDDLNLVSALVYDIQQQYAREEDVEIAKKSLDETLFSVFHHVISEAPVTKGKDPNGLIGELSNFGGYIT